jgi:hypothetical protein
MSKEKEKRLCQHIMLPVLIKHEFALADEAVNKRFIEVISSQLESFSSTDKESVSISEELLDHLLRQRRILVIMDGLSEMSKAIHEKIDFKARSFPVKALAITSRTEKQLLGLPKTTIEPQRINISKFMKEYLTEKGESDLSKSQEFSDACDRLSLMDEKQESTVLLVTLYAEQMIAAKDNNEPNKELYKKIHGLMFSYLNHINSKVSKDKQRNIEEVKRNAKEVAWECLKEKYQPAPAKKQDVLKALEVLIGSNQANNGKSSQEIAQENIQYLEECLHLIKIETVESEDKISFTFNPLAEYLAALRLVDDYRDNQQQWNDFLANFQNHPPQDIKSFLLAVKDCCLVKQKDVNVPSVVLDKLNQWIELNVKLSSSTTKP